MGSQIQIADDQLYGVGSDGSVYTRPLHASGGWRRLLSAWVWRITIGSPCSGNRYASATWKRLPNVPVLNGELSFEVRKVIARTNGEQLSRSSTQTFASTIRTGLLFKSDVFDVDLGQEVKREVSNTIANSFTQSFSDARWATVKGVCRHRPGYTASVWQWALEEPFLGWKAMGSAVRCIYDINGGAPAPQCPDGFCGDDRQNPTCAADRCIAWRA